MDCDRVEADRKGTWSDRKVAWTRPEIWELEARIGVAMKSSEARWDEVRREGRWLRSNGWTVRIDELEPSFFFPFLLLLLASFPSSSLQAHIRKPLPGTSSSFQTARDLLSRRRPFRSPSHHSGSSLPFSFLLYKHEMIVRLTSIRQAQPLRSVDRNLQQSTL